MDRRSLSGFHLRPCSQNSALLWSGRAQNSQIFGGPGSEKGRKKISQKLSCFDSALCSKMSTVLVDIYKVKRSKRHLIPVNGPFVPSWSGWERRSSEFVPWICCKSESRPGTIAIATIYNFCARHQNPQLPGTIFSPMVKCWVQFFPR